VANFIFQGLRTWYHNKLQNRLHWNPATTPIAPLAWLKPLSRQASRKYEDAATDYVSIWTNLVKWLKSNKTTVQEMVWALRRKKGEKLGKVERVGRVWHT
jgi:hypothetical protein